MGKKYIIKLLDDCPSEFKGIIVFGLTPEGQIATEPIPVEDLTPYTEPDLEQVRKEAYEQGYKKCLSEHDFDSPCVSCDEYKRGLADAWEAARKVTQVRKYGGYGDCLEEVFGCHDTTWDVFDYSASECIEKIRQYEQGKEEQIQVGDEVITASGKAVVLGVGPVHFEYVNADGSNGFAKVKNAEKTGRHFPEIAEVLRKMKETDNG